MTQPAPIRARSRTCDWFQMLVPGPISADGETSAVGWMRTDGRSFMRSPRGPVRILAARPRGRNRARRSEGQAADARCGSGHRSTAMADPVLLPGGELRVRPPVRELEDRVVAEARLAAALGGDPPLYRAGEELDLGLVVGFGARDGQRQPADHPCSPVIGAAQALEEMGRVVGDIGPAKARRVDTGAPVERGDFDAGVVGEGEATAQPAEGDRLGRRVLRVRVVWLRDVQPEADLAGRQDPDLEVGEEPAELAKLARVVGRDQELPHSPAGAPIAWRWSS